MGAKHTYRYVSVSKFSPTSLGSTLEKSSWKAIAYHAYIGDLSSKFSVGATKTLTLSATKRSLPLTGSTGGGYVTLNGIGIYMEIAGFNHDGNTGTVDFICKTCPNITFPMNDNSSDPYYGFAGAYIRALLSTVIYESIPTDCSEYILEKTTHVYARDMYYSYGKQSSVNKIWIPTFKEVVDDTRYDHLVHPDELTYHETYPIFTDATSRIRKINTTATTWWLASYGSSGSYQSAIFITTTGVPTSNSQSYYNGIAFGFRL